MKGCIIINKKNRRLVSIMVLIALILALIGMTAAILVMPMRYSDLDRQNSAASSRVVDRMCFEIRPTNIK